MSGPVRNVLARNCTLGIFVTNALNYICQKVKISEKIASVNQYIVIMIMFHTPFIISK